MSVKKIQQLVTWSAIEYSKKRNEQLKELEELKDWKRENWCIVCDINGCYDFMVGKWLVSGQVDTRRGHSQTKLECDVCKNMSHELCLTRFSGDGFFRHVCNNCATNFGTHCSVCNVAVEWDNHIGGQPDDFEYMKSETAFACCTHEKCQSCQSLVGVICKTCRPGARCVMALR